MEYQGTYELQPVYDGHKSFYGKAFVERWNAKNGMRYVLVSYGTTVATVKAVSAPNVGHDAFDGGVGGECLSETVNPVSARDVEHEMFEIRIGMECLSATTLRHVKEFLAQIDGTFKGVTLGWIRKAIKDGQTIDGENVEPICRRTYVLKTL